MIKINELSLLNKIDMKFKKNTQLHIWKEYVTYKQCIMKIISSDAEVVYIFTQFNGTKWIFLMQEIDTSHHCFSQNPHDDYYCYLMLSSC